MQPQPGYPQQSYAYDNYPPQQANGSAAPAPGFSAPVVLPHQYTHTTAPTAATSGTYTNTYPHPWQSQQPPQQHSPHSTSYQQHPIAHQQQQQPLQQQPQQQQSQQPTSYANYAAAAPVHGVTAYAPQSTAPAPAYGHPSTQTAAAPSPYPTDPHLTGQVRLPFQGSQPPTSSQSTVPLLETPSQPTPAGPGQALGSYAYPGAAQPAPRPQLTPQQVAQEAIARTMASMGANQLAGGPIQDNRRGYLHGTLIGQMEKARLERAAEKNENYVRRKDEIARRKRLGIPLDGLIDPKKIALESAAAAKPKPSPRPPQIQGGGQSRAGIGTAGAKVQNTSVYIAGLPTDITQARIELIFSQHGKVKKVKIYREESGQAKGDALVTYAKAASVDFAVAKTNGHEIAEGYPISVSMADFGRTKSGGADETERQVEPPPPPPSDHNNWNQPPELGDGGGGEQQPLPPLPPECDGDKHPVVVLQNVYTREESDADPNFFDDLEADMLMECVKYGTVIRVSTPETLGYFGSVCVTFDASNGARECAKAMHGRWFDQRQIEAVVMGKEVEVEEEPKGGIVDGVWQGREELEAASKKQQAKEVQNENGDTGARKADSPPPPTDLDSFLESV